MDWPASRLLALLASVAGGAGAAMLPALALGAGTGAAAAMGGALGALAWSLRDLRHARRLLAWLRDPDPDTPLVDGPWGEVGERVQRLQREHAASLQAEREHLTRFLAAIDASPNGVLLLDAEGQIAWCNRVAADHLGLDPVRDQGQRLTHLVRAPGFVDWLQQRDAAGALTIPAPDGRGTLFVQSRGFGEGMRLVLSQDITERERADAMRRDFVANVSHEIRTPLTVLSGFVETMQTLPLTEPERRRVLQLMAQQTDRMQLLVADLLVLARLEGSPRPPSDHWVPLAQLFDRAAADARTLSAGRHWIEVEAAPAVEIAGNDAELLSAIGNLLGNAVRYTPDEGRIDLRWVERTDGGTVEVADTGIGIAREHLARLTERFYRVDASRARETGGTGLGLSIVKHVMQRHGGAIEIDSTPGKGSRFRLVFPRARLRGAGLDGVVNATRAATLP